MNNLINEVWRDIPGYKNLYQISDQGRVRSLKFGKEKILSPGLNKNGYYHIALCLNGKIRRFFVHRLVAMTFIFNPENKDCVDHINGVRSDNRLENLRFCTKKENSNFPLARKNNSDSKLNNPKLLKPVLQIDKNTGDVIKEYSSINEASREANVHNSSISHCCSSNSKKKQKTAGGFIWKYK